jgi:alkyl hydroperoxide reductase subunit AhpC
MSTLGGVRVGKKAPDFRCDAVNRGIIEGTLSVFRSITLLIMPTEVTLGTYINEDKKTWLILLFIPAAFSFVCPTEVLAFQNCLEEFRDRNCEVIFISVDSKHSLWHWQNVPRQYGGLGQIEIALLSDASHKMSRDYGVLIEEEGVCLRGMFILDEETVVQQVQSIVFYPSS